jgi:hypothetical protein
MTVTTSEPYIRDGITVVIQTGRYPKCLRCSHRVASVDTDPVFPCVCDRCAESLRYIMYDINYENKCMLPSKLHGVTFDEFVIRFCRPELHGLMLQDICKVSRNG